MDSKKQLEQYIKPALWQTLVTWLLFAVVILSLAVGLISLNTKDNTATAVKFDPSRTSKGSFAYIDTVLVSDWIYDIDNGQKVYYTVMDEDGEWYVVQLSKQQFSDMSEQYAYFNGDEDAVMPAPYRLYGLVQKPDNDVRDAVSSYWSISTVEYPQYFGSTHLNATSTPSGERGAIMLVIAMISFFTWIVFFAMIIGPATAAKKSIKRLANLGEIDNAAYELIDPTNESINRDRVRFARNYIFAKGSGTAVKYSDIIRCYRQTINNRSGVTTSLIAQTTTAKKLILFSVSGYDNSGFVQRAFEILIERNPAIQVG